MVIETSLVPLVYLVPPYTLLFKSRFYIKNFQAEIISEIKTFKNSVRLFLEAESFYLKLKVETVSEWVCIW